MDDLERDLIRELGGMDNIREVQDCMTRLRVVVGDVEKADKNGIEKLAGVMKVFEKPGEFHIVLGPGKTQKMAQRLNKVLKEG